MTQAAGSRAKGAARRGLVIDAAVRAIADKGLANVRVSDVAERAGMTPGHVTYYFPAKSDLLMLAIRRSEEELVRLAERELAAIDDPGERLRRLIDLSASSGPGDPGWILWFQTWSEAATNAQAATVHAELDDRWRRILREVLADGRARGAFAFDDLDDASTLLSAAIDGLSIQLTVGAPGIDRARLLALCQTLCASLVGAPAASD